MPQDQLQLAFGPLRNSSLFSNHWLARRLESEPEWNELRPQAQAAMETLEAIWAQQRTRVEQYGSEQGLEYAFIQPVLEAIGWKINYQVHLRGRKPDYALFVDDASLGAALAAGRQSPDFWKHPAILADAKAWDVSLDRPSGGGKAREYPPQQIEWYLQNADLPFAILTNGRLWRLIPRQHSAEQPRFETYLECNLAKLLDLFRTVPSRGRSLEHYQRLWEVFLRFYLFFSPAGFVSMSGRTPLVQRALEGSSEYRLGVGEGLKARVFKALEICIEGLLVHGPNKLDPQTDMAACRANSFTLLYRLLFIMYAEDRGLLPYRRNKAYTENRSLGRYRDGITSDLNAIALGRRPDYAADSTVISEDLTRIFHAISAINSLPML